MEPYRYLCKICNRVEESMTSSPPRFLICFDCHRELGNPRNGEELHDALVARPDLLSAVIHAGRI